MQTDWKRLPKIDAHVHITLREMEHSDIGLNPPETYLQVMAAQHIERAVVLPINFPYYHAVPDGRHRYDQALVINNDKQAELARYSEKFICFADVYFHPSFAPELTFHEVERAITRLHLAGLKIHCPNMRRKATDPLILDLVRYAKKHNIPVIFHCNPEQHGPYADANDRLAEIAKGLAVIQYERVLIAHMGGEDHALLQEMPCYFDLSLASNRLWNQLSPHQLAEKIRAIGVERCCFATDFPVESYERYYEKLAGCDFTDAEIEKISHYTITKFLAGEESETSGGLQGRP